MATYGYTKRELKVLSSPACSPQYTMTVPAGTRVKFLDAGRPVVDQTYKIIGGNNHDLTHYYVWIDSAEVENITVGTNI